MPSLDEIQSMLNEAERLKAIAEKAIAEKAASFTRDSDAYQIIKEMVATTAKENYVEENFVVQMLLKDFPVKKQSQKRSVRKTDKKTVDKT